MIFKWENLWYILASIKMKFKYERVFMASILEFWQALLSKCSFKFCSSQRLKNQTKEKKEKHEALGI